MARSLKNSPDEAANMALRLASAYSGDRAILRAVMEDRHTAVPLQGPIAAQEVTPQEIRHIERVETTAEAPEMKVAVEEESAFGSFVPKVMFVPEADTNPDDAPEFVISSATGVQIVPIMAFDEPGSDGPTIQGSRDGQHDDIINRFIQDEPRIGPTKKDFFKPGDIARMSSQMPDDLATETLAMVFERQNQFAQAVEIYRKLILLKPEKSIYFAARIEELHAKI